MKMAKCIAAGKDSVRTTGAETARGLTGGLLPVLVRVGCLPRGASCPLTAPVATAGAHGGLGLPGDGRAAGSGRARSRTERGGRHRREEACLLSSCAGRQGQDEIE